MKYFRNLYLVVGIGLIVGGVTAIVLALALRNPATEIKPIELEGLLATKGLSDARVTPTPYAGIYEVEGSRKVGKKTVHIFIRTHLDEAQVKTILGDAEAKVEMPGQSMRGQWISILSTLLVGGLVIFLFMLQLNVGKGKSAHVRHRPTVAFTFADI